jgi:UDP-2,3-diacylglucosamine pyrophosphatase LpxH
VRTLIISDLHLGGRMGHDVLTRPRPLARLLEALDGIDRLVLLGDTVELMEGRAQQAMNVAEPVLRAIGHQLGAAREVVLVPGNHDAPLVRAWVRQHRGELQLQTPIEPGATPALARVTAWLSPSHVRVSYPGVWLAPRVWATHGHYLNRHLVPESTYGVLRGLLGGLPWNGASPGDYEQSGRPSLAQATRFLPRPLVMLLYDLAELARASTMPGVRRRLLHRRIAPLTSALLGQQMQRASIPALARVVRELGVDADWVVFGHVHRLGPIGEDDPQQWRAEDAGPAIVNTGSWLYEPLLVHRATPPHPYWPGGAVLLEDANEPRPIGLLDDLHPRELR